ncbi:hypothetical protein NL676_002353 [Syzygium grande]|nr:hypothetical protein NL676_002353 [Syzygium grande]
MARTARGLSDLISLRAEDRIRGGKVWSREALGSNIVRRPIVWPAKDLASDSVAVQALMIIEAEDTGSTCQDFRSHQRDEIQVNGSKRSSESVGRSDASNGFSGMSSRDSISTTNSGYSV